MRSVQGLVISLFIAMLSACAANVKETHYFGVYEKNKAKNAEPVNFYRLRVEGSAKFSSARYLSGNYDERAVDLFFNEIRTSSSNKSTLFKDNLKEPGTSTTIKPLSPSAGHGAFVLIMSTDADSVSNAIGSFAESQAVASAITNIIAKEKIKEKSKSDARIGVAVDRGVALEQQLSKLLTEAGQQDADAKAAESAYLRMLNALARALGHDNGFSSFDEAREWFRIQQSASGG